MILAWDNLIDAAALISGSARPTLPVTYVQHPHLGRRWWTEATVSVSHLLADLGAARTADLVGLFGTNLTAQALVRVRASLSDAGATSSLVLDTGDVAPGTDPAWGGDGLVVFASTSARYWRIDLSDTALDHLEIGRVFLGPAHRPGPGSGIQPDWNWSIQDLSQRQRAEGGQVYVDARAQMRTLEVTLIYSDASSFQAGPVAALRATGLTGDLLVVPDERSALRARYMLWGMLAQINPIAHEQSRVFRHVLQIEERL